jgi:DNA (cytosine-5)-methyltransferase 1
VGGTAREGEGRLEQRERLRPHLANGGAAVGMADGPCSGQPRSSGSSGAQEQRAAELRRIGGLSDAQNDYGRGGERGTEAGIGSHDFGRGGSASGGSGSDSHAPNRRRGDADWLLSRDAKWRPVEPGTFPLAHAAPARVGRLRGYGNALDFETALLWVETVKAHLDGAPAERLAA